MSPSRNHTQELSAPHTRLPKALLAIGVLVCTAPGLSSCLDDPNSGAANPTADGRGTDTSQADTSQADTSQAVVTPIAPTAGSPGAPCADNIDCEASFFCFDPEDQIPWSTDLCTSLCTTDADCPAALGPATCVTLPTASRVCIATAWSEQPPNACARLIDGKQPALCGDGIVCPDGSCGPETINCTSGNCLSFDERTTIVAAATGNDTQACDAWLNHLCDGAPKPQ